MPPKEIERQKSWSLVVGNFHPGIGVISESRMPQQREPEDYNMAERERLKDAQLDYYTWIEHQKSVFCFCLLAEIENLSNSNFSLARLLSR